MARIDMTLLHDLPRQEARHRVEALVEQLHRRYASFIDGVEQRWDGSTLMFSLQRGRQSIPGEVLVRESAVCISLVLPWTLSFWRGRVQQVLEEEGRRLLDG